MLFLMTLLMSGHMMAQGIIVTGTITDANDGFSIDWGQCIG